MKEKAGGPVAKLHLMADIATKELSVKELYEGTADVGHTWISLQWNDPTQVPDDMHADHKALLKKPGKYADTIGFWPDGGYSTDLLDSWVSGEQRNPDKSHNGYEKATRTYDLDRAEVDKVISYAGTKKGSKYSLFFYNCSTFAEKAVKAAGKSPPSMSKLGICFPNAVYDGIKDNQDAGVGNTSVVDMDDQTRTTEVEGKTSKGN